MKTKWIVIGLPLAEDRLVLDDATIEHPYLEGTCPAPPYTIVLGEGRKDADGISCASGCDWYNTVKCVYFGLDALSSPPALPA